MAPTRQELITERGAVADTLLKSDFNEDIVYDVIVVGSGMGGGVVASALADENKRVPVLEDGSLLFPTHKHIWSLWENFSVRNYNNVANSQHSCGQGFNLGGRSIFWSNSIPPLADWELEGGYPIAEGVFNSDTPKLGDFHTKSTAVLSKLLGDQWEVLAAPVAVEYAGPTEWSVPAGIFSTADLLLEDTMVENSRAGKPVHEQLTVNLNHAAWNVVLDPNNNNRVTGVRCWDLINQRERTYKARAVVLSAGTLESAKIALNSNIPNDKIGRGIVNHPIFYRHFVVPPEALRTLDLNLEKPSVQPPRTEPQSTKILIRHQSATQQSHGFDIILELGAQFNQGRFVDRDHVEDDLIVRNGYLLCELVFQFYAPLIETNTVTLGQVRGHRQPVRL